MPLRAVCCLLIALAGAALQPGPAAIADAAAEHRTVADRALKRLASPVLSERREGVARLVELLPGVRPRVIEALPRSPWSVQVHLIEVLAQDRSEEAVQALLEHLTRTEATQSVLIQTTIAEDRKAAGRLLAAWRADPAAFLERGGKDAPGPARLGALVRLLRRAEIEELFLGRKSKSGSTGYYKGQYERLRGKGKESDYLRHALEVVTGIALDEAIPTAGIFTSGVYRFVRPHSLDEWELRSMALNAVGELCTREDKLVVTRLERHLVQVMGERSDLFRRMRMVRREQGYDYDSKVFQNALSDWEDALGEYLDTLSCLHQIEPDRYGPFVTRFVEELQSFRWPYRPLRVWGYIAGLLIRAGRYDQAMAAYRKSMGRGGSRALGFYNMACASASASRKIGLSASRRTGYLDDALMYLSLCVSEGWSDVDWMNEDRDLDPIREHRGSAYAHLVVRIKQEWHVPDALKVKKDGKARDPKPGERK